MKRKGYADSKTAGKINWSKCTECSTLSPSVYTRGMELLCPNCEKVRANSENAIEELDD